MPISGKRDQYSDAPKFKVNDKNETGQQQFGNTVFGVSAAEASTSKKLAHAGWVRVTTGSGGRSGRKQYETLSAFGSMTTDATSFSNTSSANVANTTGTADDSTFPDA